MNAAGEGAPGFHGKLVAKGDFVTRRLPRGFLDPWDAWLQDVVGGSRQRMGEAWLDAYLTSPIWRFVLSTGLCGDAPAAGVLMPSVDRVGRYFPLSLAAILPEDAEPVEVFVSAGAWFSDAESIVRSTLEDGFDFDRFDEQVAALGPPLAPAARSSPAVAAAGLRVTVAASDGVADAYRQIARQYLMSTYPRCSLWWTAGSSDVAPTLLVCGSLPTPDAFGAFLDGRWEQWGWGGTAGDARVLLDAEM